MIVGAVAVGFVLGARSGAQGAGIHSRIGVADIVTIHDDEVDYVVDPGACHDLKTRFPALPSCSYDWFSAYFRCHGASIGRKLGRLQVGASRLFASCERNLLVLWGSTSPASEVAQPCHSGRLERVPDGPRGCASPRIHGRRLRGRCGGQQRHIWGPRSSADDKVRSGGVCAVRTLQKVMHSRWERVRRPFS